MLYFLTEDRKRRMPITISCCLIMRNSRRIVWGDGASEMLYSLDVKEKRQRCQGSSGWEQVKPSLLCFLSPEVSSQQLHANH